MFNAHDGQRIERDGFRWAPKSLISELTGPTETFKFRNPTMDYRGKPGALDIAHVGEHGIHVQ